jgi:hypothetical protein
MRSLDCHIAALLAMTRSNGRAWFRPSISDASPNVDIANHKVVWQSTHFCHCEPVRVWQSSLRRYVGCRDDAGGWPCAIAGLPRRDSVPPRNDNAKTGRVTKGVAGLGAVGCAVAGLPCRCAPRNDKKREWWTSISDASPNVDIARKVSKRTDVAIHTLLSLRARQGVAIQSETLCGMPGRCGGLALRYRWIATSGLRPSSQ